jgi:D-alanyl-D-alanine endopeptidase (penicillin-binding protein 7)
MRLIALFLIVASSTCWSAEPSILLFNQTTDKTIIAQAPDRVRSFASITKLMTAIVALDSDRSMYALLPLYSKMGSLLPQKRYTREELLTAMLVRSDNAAAETIAQDYPGGRVGFLKAMNQKAQQLGMTDTKFVDPTGLSVFNVSTAHDIVKLLKLSATTEFIRTTSVKKQAIFETAAKKQIRKIVLPNTNAPMLFQFDNIVVTKTGLTNNAGWCVGLVVEQNNQIFYIVVLGAKNKQERFDKIKDIMYNHIIDKQF